MQEIGHILFSKRVLFFFFFISVNIGKGTHCLWFMVSGVSLKIAFRDDLLILKGLLSNLSKDFKQ